MSKRLSKELSYLLLYSDNNFIEHIPSTLAIHYRDKYKTLNKLGVNNINNIERHNNTMKCDMYIRSRLFSFTFNCLGYPFKNPTVTVNNKPYSLCVKYKYLQFFGITNLCTCSSSILCRNNWRPTLLLIDILIEFVDNFTKYTLRLENKYQCNLLICYSKLGFYLPICKYL
jgi:hypothetical protein